MEKDNVLFQAICNGNQEQVEAVVKEKLSGDGDSVKMLNEIMIPAMREIGEKFSRNEIFVPHMLISARAMQSGLKIIEPYLLKAGHKSKGKLVIGTVKGDMHDIGKNLVVIMLKGAGYEVNDLGVDCGLDKFDDAVKDGAQVLLCSALLTTTMTKMQELVEHCKEKHPNIKVVIGGAPVTQNFADSIDADAYGEDASVAVKIVDKFF
jgi:5-methyltetrahydrofolate--homocysteine methyltransferase